jgi:hypothetical protein
MNRTFISKKIQEILNDLNNKNFDKVIKKFESICKEKIGLSFEIWKEQIEVYESDFHIKIDKFKLFTNIGVILFKIGKITNSIDFYKLSIH